MELMRHAWTGAKLICPACHRGAIYRNFTQMNPKCPQCGVVFERDEGDFVGAMVLAYSVTAVLVVVGILVLELVSGLTATQHVLLWTAFTTLFMLVTYRNMKGAWIGILHAMSGLRAD